MHILLQRLTMSNSGIFGILLIDGRPYFTTLELPWKDNARNVSCIPPGVYHATKMYSQKFSKDVYVLNDVPGRDLIEFHIGNTVKDTNGCILLGMQYNYTDYGIVSSRLAFENFMTRMPEEGFTLSVMDIVVDEKTSWV